MSGIQSGEGVIVDREGKFGEFGNVFYSEDAFANILLFASQVDAGVNIRYDYVSDCFTLRPKGSNNVYRLGKILLLRLKKRRSRVSDGCHSGAKLVSI